MATSSNAPLFEITFDPTLARVRAYVDVLGLEITKFKQPLSDCVSKVVIPSIRQNFDAGGRPAWAPYADTTIEMHKILKEALSSGLLVKTGALRSAMGELGIWTISDDEAYINGLPSNVWYGALHQAGYPGGESNGPIPARPFVLLQDQDLDDIDAIFDKWLHEAIVKAWPGD